MPIYEYQCRKCNEVTEALQKMSDDPLTECNSCGGELKRLVSAPAVQFKGSGWYVTDYAGKKGDGKSSGDSKGDASGSASSGSSDSSSGSDASSKSKSSDASSGSKESSGSKSSSSGDKKSA